MSAHQLITDHLDLWTQAVTQKSTAGRGSNGKVELTGIKKLRELILELAVRGKLVEQDPDDESVELLLNKIESEKCAQLKAKTIRKPKKLPSIERAEQPFSIPNNWRFCRLNDIGTWGSGATPKRGNLNYYGGEIPWFKSGELYKDFINRSEETITDLAVQETSVRMNKPGDVLIAMYGATIGKASILEVKGTTNQAVCACTPWQGISNRFLLLLLKAYRSRFIAMGAGGAQPNISRDKIIATVIGLPPEQEQLRIVQKVDELMALCDRLEQHTSDQLDAHETLVDTLLGTLTQSANASELADNWARLAEYFDTLFITEQSIDKLKQTILQLAVMGRLVEQKHGKIDTNSLLHEITLCKKRLIDEEKLKKQKTLPAIADKEKTTQIPESWEWVRLQDVIDVRDGTHDSPKNAIGPDTYPLVTSKDFRDGQIDFSNAKRISEEDHRLISQRSLVEPEDILFSMIGGNIGNQVLVNTSEKFSVKNVALFKYYDKTLTVPRFLKIFTEDLANSLQDQASGGAQPFVSLGKLRNLPFPIAPIEEQHRIVQKVDELMALCDHLKDHLNQASNTRCQLAGAIVEQGLSA